MSPATGALTGLLVLAAAVWIGGYVAMAVVSNVAARTLSADDRITFFRRLGQAWAKVAVSALVVAFAIGSVLLARRPFDGRAGLTVGLAAVLFVVAGAGMIQARRMGSLRLQALEAANDRQLAARLRVGVRVATALRASIGLASVALLAMGVLLGVR
jgi:hypothetical protein